MAKRVDWTLLAICAGAGRPLSPVQLQKSLFLFEQEYSEEIKGTSYLFRPYDYGPFSSKIYSDAEQLAEDDMVAITRGTRGWSQYAATQEGLNRAKSLAKTVDPDALDFLRRVVEWALSSSFEQIVRAIYDKYPQYRAQSVFRY